MSVPATMADEVDPCIIPVIDIGPIKFGKEDPGLEDCKSVGDQLSKAFADIGFAYLSNHGIPTEEIKMCYEAAVDFFALPNETKMKYLRMPGNQHGYSEMSKEKVDPKDPLTEVHEAFNFLDQECPDDEVPHFRKDLKALSDTCKRLVYALLKCLSLSLDLDPGFFKKYHDFSSAKNITNLRVLHYPSVSQGENVTRMGAHTDFGTLTLVFQDAVGGLQVKNNGEWVSARPIPGTVLVNIGDLLQRWTGDKWTATVHRVTLPYDEMRKQRRLSMAFFVTPDDHVMVEPVCGNKSYGRFDSTEFMLRKMEEIYEYD